ncbi:MAG: NADH:ubiquinone reductase (Na(+)-transporting) subunit A, partial [Muribaculaceae bacterium]|nr:NADH:ubiquinone reductase (Na(+)-transporting) subunit A [Muribaculaceae bacterium]
CYVKATMGCSLKSLLDGRLVEDGKEKRIISGNVLTGVKENLDGFLHAPYRHITVINEINKKDEFMGWASLSPKKYSIYRVFTSWLCGRHKEVDLDAKLNGGERAIVLCGEYDKMLPMDIYAEFLIKSIIAFDIDKMEQLGIYEVAPEDFALAEYADTSKLELQRIVREGLDKMRAEMC